MRIDARTCPEWCLGWTVWDVPACAALRHVVWVDDETNQLGRLVIAPDGRVPLNAAHDGPRIDVEQRGRIEIHERARLVLLDPIADEEPESIADANANDEHFDGVFG